MKQKFEAKVESEGSYKLRPPDVISGGLLKIEVSGLDFRCLRKKPFELRFAGSVTREYLI